MKSIANQYRDLKEGKMSQQNFMRNLRMTMPQYVTNVTSFGDAVRILKNKSIIVETTVKEDFDFTKSSIESASGDKISHIEYDDYDQPIYWSTKNPNVNYYIGSDEQIIKYDGETGERYIIGDLRNYDEPNDYEPDTDADYEEPRDDFDMAGDYNDGEFWEGKENDPEKEWDEEEEEETDDREYDEDEMFNPAYMEEGEDEDAMYDEMIKKIEDELAAREAANAQYDLDEELNEAVGNFELKKLARELYSVAKRVNGVTSVKIVTSDVKNAASAFQAASKKGNTYAEDAVMVELFVNEADSFISIILSGSARFLNPVAGEVNKQIQDFINKNYANQLETQYVKPPKDNTMLGINIRFINKPSGDVKESEELNEAKKPNVERAEDENIEEVTLGIFMEHACFPDKSYEEIEKIVKKNIKRNPNYYTNYKLTGIRDYELETMDSSKPEDHQMKFYTEKTAVDTARGMQKVKMPKKDEKKKLKESKVRTDMKGQIVQAVNSDNVTFSKNDEAKAIDNGEIIKITGFKEEQGKVKALFNKGMFASAIDIDGLEKVVSASPIAQALTKEEIEELMREVMNEYYDGRDNLIDPIAAEENN
jgi:hypothetical protein